jgi:flagellar protein FliO/FliZ
MFVSSLACAETLERENPVADPLAFSSLVQLTLGMLAVLAIIIGLAWILKRSGRFQVTAGGGLKILGGLSMGARERVVLLQVGETQLLVGVSPGSVKTLHVLDTPLVHGNEAGSEGSGFAQQLGAMLSGGKSS